MRCIYCKDDKPQGSFNIEHVMPRCLGSFQDNLTLDCVCRNCNQRLGDTLELALGRDSFEAMLRFQHRIKSLSEISQLRNKNLCLTLDVEGPWKGARLVMESDSQGITVNLIAQVGLPLQGIGLTYFTLDELRQLEQLVKPHLIVDQKINLLYNTDNDLAALIAELKRLDVMFDQQGELPRIDVSHTSLAQVDIHYREGTSVQRAIVKIAFNYAAYHLGSDVMLRSDFDPIRSFITDATKPKYQFFFISRQHPSNLGTPNRSDGHVAVLDWDKGPTRIAVTLDLFGKQQYKIVLTDRYSGLFRTDLSQGHFFSLSKRRVFGMTKGRIHLPT